MYPNDEISAIPCSHCGGTVIEFSIPNDIWNRVIRLDGHEHTNEYLCLGCFFDALRKALGLGVTLMGRKDWSGFKWDNGGGYSEVLCQSIENGMWIFLHYVNGVGVGGGAVGASYLEAVEMSRSSDKPANGDDGCNPTILNG
jgi:hypothetical protein